MTPSHHPTTPYFSYRRNCLQSIFADMALEIINFYQGRVMWKRANGSYAHNWSKPLLSALLAHFSYSGKFVFIGRLRQKVRFLMLRLKRLKDSAARLHVLCFGMKCNRWMTAFCLNFLYILASFPNKSTAGRYRPVRVAAIDFCRMLTGMLAGRAWNSNYFFQTCRSPFCVHVCISINLQTWPYSAFVIFQKAGVCMVC